MVDRDTFESSSRLRRVCGGMNKRLRVGVITDEFMEPSLGRLGGFGWAAGQVAKVFNEDPSLGVDLIYLAAEHRASPGRDYAEAHGTRIVLRQPSRLANLRKVRAERLDLLMTIDYNHGHSVYLRALPRTPAIIWVRDPRPPAEADRVTGVRIPGEDAITPQGLFSHDGASLAGIARESAWLGRPLLMASPSPHLVTRVAGAYGFEPWDFYFLPNPLMLDPKPVPKPKPRSVVFLGRLDPVKRPWLFASLAARFPDVEFRFLGQSHFSGRGSWQPADLPGNVRFLQHVGEAEKIRLLSEASVTINTSVHEGLAISFLESLACGTPLLACVDTGFVVSRYGIFVGHFDGSGVEALPAFECGLRQLLGDERRRRDLGEAGREWVRRTHSRDTFVAAFNRLRELAGVA
jgi:glycosyltransferase involved in cell wall biosynthesis